MLQLLGRLHTYSSQGFTELFDSWEELSSVLISSVATATTVENRVLERAMEIGQESFGWTKWIEEGDEDRSWRFAVGVDLRIEEEEEEGEDSKEAVAIVLQTQPLNIMVDLYLDYDPTGCSRSTWTQICWPTLTQIHSHL